MDQGVLEIIGTRKRLTKDVFRGQGTLIRIREDVDYERE